MKPKRKTAPAPPAAPRPRWLAPGALCLIALIAYANSFDSGFVFDNRDLLLNDARVHQTTLENLGRIFSQSYWGAANAAGLYRPLTTLSYLFNYAILGNTDHPAGYHWINLLLHAGNVLLLFALVRRLKVATEPSFLIAALWAVHPVLTESVTNIIGRADLLAGMTTLAGLLIYLKGARPRWLVALAAVTAVGVFSKESAVAVAAVIVLYELTWWNRSRLRGLLLALAAMTPVFLLMWWARSRVLSAEGPAVFPYVDNPIAGASFLTARLTAIKVMAKYIGLLIWPANLSADYSYAQIPLADGRHLSDWIACIVMAAAAIAMVVLWRRSKIAFFFAGFSFITLLPASNLIVPVGTIMAERFLYLPAAGFAVCLTLALYRMPRRAALVAGLAIVMAFVARTWSRNDDWHDNSSFAAAAVESSPLSFKTHMWEGAAEASDHPGRAGVQMAVNQMDQALAILAPLPDRLSDPTVYYRSGMAYLVAGRYDRAREMLLHSRAILREQHRDNPRSTPWLDNLEKALKQLE